jgi:hypothetical protein
VIFLQLEIAKIREENREYFSRPHHGQLDRNRHLEREFRLQEIVDELARLTNRKGA